MTKARMRRQGSEIDEGAHLDAGPRKIISESFRTIDLRSGLFVQIEAL